MSSSDPTDHDPESALAEPAVTEHGGRVELRLVTDQTDATHCTYSARWFIGSTKVTGTVTIQAPPSGAKVPTVTLEADELPDWLCSFTTQLVKLTCRSVLLDQPDFEKAVWPRRLTRWRRADGE